ncbi:MAG TPA: hypothetical protein VMC85_11115 [Desulfomonilaceae bacterium]|nr:hypothetical protein [Desulfomonilaceae bacterium]
MTSYKIDRGLLEQKSTEEIVRILKKERDDYAPEALVMLEEILRTRGVEPAASAGTSTTQRSETGVAPYQAGPEELIGTPGDAVKVLNHLLSGVLNGTVDPQVGQVASNIVMGILRAMEQELMQEPEEGR